MKLNIELNEEDIAKIGDLLGDLTYNVCSAFFSDNCPKEVKEFIDTFKTKLAEEFNKDSSKQQKEEAQRENYSDNETMLCAMRKFIKTLCFNDKTNLEVAITSVNNIIDCTGNATLLDYSTYAIDNELSWVKDALTDNIVKEELAKYGWNKPLTDEDIMQNEDDEYYINSDNVVKLM